MIAISLTRSDDGHWHLGVHIADVAHFVRSGSALDREARNRGTSGICLGMSFRCFPKSSPTGWPACSRDRCGSQNPCSLILMKTQVQGADVANTAIRVTRRFAYEEVMPIIRNPRQPAPGVTAPFDSCSSRCTSWPCCSGANGLLGEPSKWGSPKSNRLRCAWLVTGAHERHHDESHEIIEEFMLAANIAVANCSPSRTFPSCGVFTEILTT